MLLASWIATKRHMTPQLVPKAKKTSMRKGLCSNLTLRKIE
jgi:hypothetical protein